MRIKRYILGELQANCYLLSWNDQCILIDPADEGGFLLEELSRQNLHLTAMLATHGHFDHIMAAGEIQLSIPVPLYMHKDDLFLVKRLKDTAEHFLGRTLHIIKPGLLKEISGGEDWQINALLNIRAIETPGHTPGGVSFYLPQEQAVFTGDTLFAEGAVGRTDFSYGNKGDLEDSVNALLTLPEETVLYPGHGEETIIVQARQFFHF